MSAAVLAIARILLLTLTLASCGDSASGGVNTGGENGGAGGAGGNAGAPGGLPRPDLSALEAEIPAPLDAAADADPGGAPARIRLHLTQLNGFEAWTTFLDVAVEGGTGVTQTETSAVWTVGNLRYTLEYRGSIVGLERRSDWRIFRDGDDGAFIYDNELFIDTYYEPFTDIGVQSDAFGRWLEVYDPNQTDEAARFWRVAFMDEGVLAFHRRGNFSIFLLKKVDGTFFFEYQVNSEPNLRGEWDASGNGTWTLFDAAGAPIDSGSF